MTMNTTASKHPFWRSFRWLVWGGLAVLLALPLVAMQFTTEVQWTLSDFIVMGGLMGLVGIAFEVAVRVARSHAYVVAAGIAVASGFVMTWINLAVGIIGDEGNPANLMFFGVLLVGLVAVACSRLRPLGMARAMEVTAAALALVCVATLVIGEGHIFVLTGFFLTMWLAAAQLFRKAARDEVGPAGTLRIA